VLLAAARDPPPKPRAGPEKAAGALFAGVAARAARPDVREVVAELHQPTIGPRGLSFDVRCWQMRTFQLGHFGSE
jgi:hypothetical protein